VSLLCLAVRQDHYLRREHVFTQGDLGSRGLASHAGERHGIDAKGQLRLNVACPLCTLLPFAFGASTRSILTRRAVISPSDVQLGLSGFFSWLAEKFWPIPGRAS
jgi:hypothetical protein